MDFFPSTGSCSGSQYKGKVIGFRTFDGEPAKWGDVAPMAETPTTNSAGDDGTEPDELADYSSIWVELRYRDPPYSTDPRLNEVFQPHEVLLPHDVTNTVNRGMRSAVRNAKMKITETITGAWWKRMKEEEMMKSIARRDSNRGASGGRSKIKAVTTTTPTTSAVASSPARKRKMDAAASSSTATTSSTTSSPRRPCDGRGTSSSSRSSSPQHRPSRRERDRRKSKV